MADLVKEAREWLAATDILTVALKSVPSNDIITRLADRLEAVEASARPEGTTKVTKEEKLALAAKSRFHPDDADKIKSAKSEEWCIYTPGDGQGFLLGEITLDAKGLRQYLTVTPSNHRGYHNVTPDRIIARHPQQTILHQRLLTAQAVEKRIRPYWQAALEHSLRLEQMMRDEILKVARGE